MSRKRERIRIEGFRVQDAETGKIPTAEEVVWSLTIFSLRWLERPHECALGDWHRGWVEARACDTGHLVALAGGGLLVLGAAAGLVRPFAGIAIAALLVVGGVLRLWLVHGYVQQVAMLAAIGKPFATPHRRTLEFIAFAAELATRNAPIDLPDREVRGGLTELEEVGPYELKTADYEKLERTWSQNLREHRQSDLEQLAEVVPAERPVRRFILLLDCLTSVWGPLVPRPFDVDQFWHTIWAFADALGGARTLADAPHLLAWNPRLHPQFRSAAMLAANALARTPNLEAFHEHLDDILRGVPDRLAAMEDMTRFTLARQAAYLCYREFLEAGQRALLEMEAAAGR